MESQPEIRYVSDAAGNPVAVIVPIDLWREIESERETAYLLRSEAMRQRLLAAKGRKRELPLEDTLCASWNLIQTIKSIDLCTRLTRNASDTS